jgi:hypothetical protein
MQGGLIRMPLHGLLVPPSPYRMSSATWQTRFIQAFDLHEADDPDNRLKQGAAAYLAFHCSYLGHGVSARVFYNAPSAAGGPAGDREAHAMVRLVELLYEDFREHNAVVRVHRLLPVLLQGALLAPIPAPAVISGPANIFTALQASRQELQQTRPGAVNNPALRQAFHAIIRMYADVLHS